MVCKSTFNAKRHTNIPYVICKPFFISSESRKLLELMEWLHVVASFELWYAQRKKRKKKETRYVCVYVKWTPVRRNFCLFIALCTIRRTVIEYILISLGQYNLQRDIYSLFCRLKHNGLGWVLIRLRTRFPKPVEQFPLQPSFLFQILSR